MNRNGNDNSDIVNSQVEQLVKRLVDTLFEFLRNLNEFSTLSEPQKSLVILSAVEVLYINTLAIFLSDYAPVPEEEIKTYFSRLAEDIIKRVKSNNIIGGTESGGFSYN